MARAPCFAVLLGILLAQPARAEGPGLRTAGPKSNVDQPNPIELRLNRLRQSARTRPAITPPKSGTARALVILVEFTGPDSFEFIPSGDKRSAWDPLGASDTTEWAGSVGDCSLIAKKLGISAPKTFTYSGPLHNRIARPVSAADRSGDSIWREDFQPAHYQQMLFGDGGQWKFRRTDGSEVAIDLAGKSLNGYYKDMSGGLFQVEGEVYGWVQVPHSIWWYGADPCPGARSAPASEFVMTHGALPNAGSSHTLVRDALDALRRSNPTLDWKSFDTNNDGSIDNLWVVHAGIGEEDSPALLARTDYGEGGIWSSASSLSPPHAVAPGVTAGQFSLLPEHAGVAVSAHEFGHNLGAIDLYASRGGQASAGFWSLMSDSWTGGPGGISPGPFDPLHLDRWGWLNPLLIRDPAQEYTVRLGQASKFPGGADVHRAVKIELPDGLQSLSVSPHGSRQWWGGRLNLADARMTLTRPLSLPNTNAITLSLDVAYNLEPRYDYLWVQASSDEGRTWKTLTNANTTCTPYSDWIGGQRGFSGNLCAQSIGGFTGKSKTFPAYATEQFPLGMFAGQDILIRIWLMTDWNYQLDGVFIDNVTVKTPERILFEDTAEAGDANWTYTDGWSRVGTTAPYRHAYYLQWRNPTASGGFDAALGEGFRFGPAAGGLLVWYYNERYSDNEVASRLFDPPSFGPKGVLLLADANPVPVRDPHTLAYGFDNEGANLTARLQMRDAPFRLTDAPPFSISGYYASHTLSFPATPPNPRFRDAWAYTAGIEHTSRGPGYDPPRWEWISRHWDAGVVLPSTVSYPANAPGYPAGEGMRYNCTANTAAGTLSCAELVKDRGFDQPGGSGNPGETGGHYGWNVDVVEQSDTTATIRVWNDKAVDLPPVVAIQSPAPGAEISGSMQMELAATDERGIASVELFANGISKAIATEAPFWPAWNTTQDSNGIYNVTVRACDVSGLCTDNSRRFSVRNPDAPWVTIRSPKPGATLSTAVTVSVEVSGPVENVQLYVDGVLTAVSATALEWKANEAAPGFHSLTVFATAPEGKSGVATVTVYVPDR